MANDNPKVFRVYAREKNFNMSIVNPVRWEIIEDTICCQSAIWDTF